MKKIQELTEQEVLALTSEEIEIMIKLRKAEEGIKFVKKPELPKYHVIPEPDKTVFMCDLFGNELCTESMSEFDTIISAIIKADTKCKIDYDYNKAGSEYMFINPVLKRQYGSSDWDTITTKKVYSQELYNSIVEKIFYNKKMKENYEKENKEYINSLNESKDIESEIREYYYEIVRKYERLGDFCKMMKFDYMPLADQDEEVALRFLNKAYNLNEDQRTYVLENYKNF